jgi:hypothetical protein
MKMSKTLTKKVPKSALKLRFDKPCEFANGEPATEADGTRKFPLKMRARGGQPLYHFWWGAVVHDMAGFKPDKSVIPVDWCHSDDLMGALDKFTATNDGLDVEGFLASIEPKDRVDEVTKKSKAGIPYQASIFFDPLAIEDVAPGTSAEVNGYSIDGPATIIRQWSLRGVAVCPYGYDSQTNSQFSADDEGEIEVPLTLTAMKKTINKLSKPKTKLEADKPKTEQAEGTEKKPCECPEGEECDCEETEEPATEQSDKPKEELSTPKSQVQAELKKFVAKFGAENGSKWFSENKTFAQALELHAADLAAKLAAKDTEIAELKTRLAAAKPGEEKPVTFTDGEPKGTSAKTDAKFAHLGTGAANFAAGIKLPGKHK